jgi:long-chain acyl-CoA synthetase
MEEAVGSSPISSTRCFVSVRNRGMRVTDATTTSAERRIAHLLRGTVLSYWAEEQPDRLAVVSEHGNRTFAELDRRANQVARALRARGLRAGDAVALLSRNRPEWAEVWAACNRAGFRLTPVNWHLTGDEAGYIVDNCDAAAFVADAPNGDVARAAASLAPRCRVLLAIGGEIDGFEPYEEAVASEPSDDLDDPVMGTPMLYTSGTTGHPKGVSRSSVAPSTNAAFVMADFFDYRPGEDINLCTGPLYHAAPLAFGLTVPFLNGASIVFMDGWDAEETLRLVEQHGVTHTHMVPTMFVRLLKLPPDVRERYDVSTLRNVLHGAAPCPPRVKQALIDWLGPVVHEYYAATEGLGTWVHATEWVTRPGTVGKIDPPDHIKILDDDGREVARGTVGTIYLKAPEGGAFEYFKDTAKTASAYLDDYFTIGDVGYVDDDDFLFLTDRSANLIIFGGSNVYPVEVDHVLLDHPAVLDVATIGVPDDEWGEVVKAVVELQPGVEGTPELEAELIELARAHLAHYKCPRTVDFVAQLPRDDNGKIYKRKLRDAYRAAHAGESEG